VRGLALGALSLLAGATALAQSAAPFTTPAERCIVPAAQYHRVNPYVLRAILRVESGLNPNAFHCNSNRTCDIGIGGQNTVHLNELARYGVGPSALQDACVGTYVAAWRLGKHIAKYGNTWFAIGAYNSTTPYYNYRYQRLINNELVASGFLKGSILPVPPLNSQTSPRPKSGDPDKGSDMVIVDSESR